LPAPFQGLLARPHARAGRTASPPPPRTPMRLHPSNRGGRARRQRVQVRRRSCWAPAAHRLRGQRPASGATVQNHVPGASHPPAQPRPLYGMPKPGSRRARARAGRARLHPHFARSSGARTSAWYSGSSSAPTGSANARQRRSRSACVVTCAPPSPFPFLFSFSPPSLLRITRCTCCKRSRGEELTWHGTGYRAQTCWAQNMRGCRRVGTQQPALGEGGRAPRAAQCAAAGAAPRRPRTRARRAPRSVPPPRPPPPPSRPARVAAAAPGTRALGQPGAAARQCGWQQARVQAGWPRMARRGLEQAGGLTCELRRCHAPSRPPRWAWSDGRPCRHPLPAVIVLTAGAASAQHFINS